MGLRIKVFRTDRADIRHTRRKTWGRGKGKELISSLIAGRNELESVVIVVSQEVKKINSEG